MKQIVVYKDMKSNDSKTPGETELDWSQKGSRLDPKVLKLKIKRLCRKIQV